MMLDKSVVRVIYAERAASWTAEAVAIRLPDRPPRRSARRRIGHSMIRLGARLAADQPLDLARSR